MVLILFLSVFVVVGPCDHSCSHPIALLWALVGPMPSGGRVPLYRTQIAWVRALSKAVIIKNHEYGVMYDTAF